MKFEWDEKKLTLNIQRHQIDFVGIEEVFQGLIITILDDRFDYGEERFVTFGILNAVVLAIVHTDTDEVIRIISVRKANKNEEIAYYENIANQLGKD
jgi:uncharacterized protein